MDPRPVKKEMLVGLVSLHVEAVDFSVAKFLSENKARDLLQDPLLLAWFDKKQGKHFPDTC
jgi:hypothetical protein